MKSSQKNIYNVINQNLDVSIFKLCRQFDEITYGKILLTYSLMNKQDYLYQLLNKNFMSSIQLTCTETLINTIIRKYILTENLSSNSKSDLAKINNYIEELKRKEYLDLIKLIEIESYKSSLHELLYNIWQIIKNYYKVCIYVNLNSNHEGLKNSSNLPFYDELKKKLLSNTNGIWLEIQQKVSLFFRSMILDNFKFDDFMDILIMINK